MKSKNISFKSVPWSEYELYAFAYIMVKFNVIFAISKLE